MVRKKFKEIKSEKEIKDGYDYYIAVKSKCITAGRIWKGENGKFNVWNNYNCIDTENNEKPKSISDAVYEFRDLIRSGSMFIRPHENTNKKERTLLHENWKVGDEFYIASDETKTKHFVSNRHGNSAFINYNDNKGAISICNIVSSPLDEQQAKEYKQILRQFTDYVDNVIPRDLLFSSYILDTNSNFVNTYDLRNNFFSSFTHQTCCAFTKSALNLQVYIPVEWTNFFGYSEDNVKEYIEFLNGITNNTYNNTYELRGVGPWGTKTQKQITTFSIGIARNANLVSSPGRIRLMKDKFYEIYMRGTNDPYETYLRFIMLRYLYNHSYSSIPRICLDIRKKLPKEVTNWEIMLMALSSKNFGGYYSLTSFFIPKLTGNSIADVLKRCNSDMNHSMNDSFLYTNQPTDYFMDSFEKRDYKMIYEKLKSLSI